ncbi:MAG: SCO family protein [gamma proteobacterium symbiont of Bathyaustriella thionipta]|nr:SCO family protein [gamma proteobacterium symbiont of Bathyaustriella thionipta]MCU7952865.1 SCO family protein [gamma proteobacterium symbiont of Bathyaustriella thionipta]
MMSKKFIAPIIIFTLLLLSLLLIFLPSISAEKNGRITINRAINLPLLKQHEKETLLVFFGYSGCVDICTPRLMQIASWYDKLNVSIKKRTTLLFFDLSSPEDKNTPDRFAKTFHNDFHGIYLNRQNINNYVSAFDVYYAQSLFKANEIDHTSHLYLLKKGEKGHDLRTIYSAYPYDLLQVKTDMEGLLNE